jgi:hypothetical protein
MQHSVVPASLLLVSLVFGCRSGLDGRPTKIPGEPGALKQVSHPSPNDELGGLDDEVPNPSMSGTPGVLEQAWYASGAVETHDSSFCTGFLDHLDPNPCFGPHYPNRWASEVDPLDPVFSGTGITEIAIERTSCYGFCPIYTFILRCDGTVKYTGQANVEKVGEHMGRIDKVSFGFLARLAVDIGFFDELRPYYSCDATDLPTAYVSIVRNGERKTIKHYAPGDNDPPRLQAFELLLDEAYKHVQWN